MRILAAAVAAMLITGFSTSGERLTAGGPAAGGLAAGGPALASALALAGVRPPYRAPLPGAPRVLTPFAPPATKYGAGHLGVDLAAAAGVPVLAAGTGVVRFAGQVAGRGVVVLVHPDGISTEYEPVAAAVLTGQSVAAGQRIGRLQGRHHGCLPASCLHWGARRGTGYLDPLALLRPLGAVRLLPWSVLRRGGAPG